MSTEESHVHSSTIVDGLVSVIIPVYNRPCLLKEAVASVLAQTYRPLEIIIIDDGSTDSTPDVIAELLESNPEIVSARKENEGPGAARELARSLARGEYIQYLDSDDLLKPDKFLVQVEALVSTPEAGIAYGITYQTDLQGAEIPVPVRLTGQKIDYLFPELLMSRWWSTTTPLYRRGVTDAIGPWSTLSSEEDWEYDARAAKQGTGLVFCEIPVSVRRIHDEHLHHGGSSDPAKLADRAKARALIYAHAVEAGFVRDSPQWEHFVRSLFLLARQCGAAGMAGESRDLYRLARRGSGKVSSKIPNLALYGLVAPIVGWVNIGRLSAWLDECRKR